MSIKNKVPEPALKKETLQVVEVCDYTFTNEELLELGQQLAAKNSELTGLEADRKQAADEWKSRISSAESQSQALAHKIRRKCEPREFECTVVMNEPKGKKTCWRNDTQEKVWEMFLTKEEMQGVLALEKDQAGAQEETE